MARSIEEITAQLQMVNDEIATLSASTPGYYNEGELARMYSLDPKAAEFFANRQAQEATLKSRESIAALKLGDISKKDKLELQQLWKDNTRALEGAKARGEAQSVIDTYADNVDRLVKQLQAIDPTTWGEPTSGSNKGEPNLEAAKTEGNALIVDSKDVNPKDGVIDNISGVETSIRALKDKYNISDKDVNDILLNLTSKANEINAKFESAKDLDRIAYERNKDRLDNAINGWKSAVNDWKTIRSKAKSAITNFKNQNWGASQTITMKALLGDALSEQERSVMSSKGFGQSVFGGLWSKLTNSATPVSKSDAEKVVKSLIDFVNSLSDDFKGFTNNKYVLDGLGLSKGILQPLTLNAESEAGKPLPAPVPGKAKSGGKADLLKALKAGKK